MSETFGDFEIAVQTLAEQLAYVETGGVPPHIQIVAQHVADIINTRRAELIEEFPAEPAALASQKIQGALDAHKARPFFQQDAEAGSGLNELARDMQQEQERRERMGHWLFEIVPKMAATKLQPRKVINSLLAHPELGFNLHDFDTADTVMLYQQKARENEEVSSELITPILPETSESSEEVSPDEIQKAADKLLRIMVVNNGHWRTKASIRSAEFRAALEAMGETDREKERKLFHEAWGLLEAIYREIDPSFVLFANDGGVTRGRRYHLDDPEMALVCWDEESDNSDVSLETETTASLESQTRGLVKGYRHGVISFEDGSHMKLSPLQERVFDRLWGTNPQSSVYCGMNDLIQSVASKEPMPRAQAEQYVRSFISELGSAVDKFFNSKRNKLIVQLKRSRLQR